MSSSSSSRVSEFILYHDPQKTASEDCLYHIDRSCVSLYSGMWKKFQMKKNCLLMKSWNISSLDVNDNANATILREIYCLNFPYLKNLNLEENSINSIECLSKIAMPNLRQISLKRQQRDQLPSCLSKMLLAIFILHLVMYFPQNKGSNPINNPIFIQKLEGRYLECLRFGMNLCDQGEDFRWYYKIGPNHLKKECKLINIKEICKNDTNFMGEQFVMMIYKKMDRKLQVCSLM